MARKPADINKQCASCHTDVWASFQRPYKHKLPRRRHVLRGLPQSPRQLRCRSRMQTVNANEPGCFKCHGDKRGPFTFEHAPVRLEGCAACHEPHGSANPRMLTRATRCASSAWSAIPICPAPTPPANGTLGTVPPAIHDLRSPRFQNCNHLPSEGAWLLREPGLLQMRFLLALIADGAGIRAAGRPAAKRRRPDGADARQSRPSTRQAPPTADRSRSRRRIARPLPPSSGSPAASISAIAGSPTSTATFPSTAASSIWAKGPNCSAWTSPCTDPKKRLFDRLDAARLRLGRRSLQHGSPGRPQAGHLRFQLRLPQHRLLQRRAVVRQSVRAGGLQRAVLRHPPAQHRASRSICFPASTSFRTWRSTAIPATATASTTWVQDANNEFAVPTLLRDSTNNYRGGVRFEYNHFHVTLEQGGTTFKDDDQANFDGVNPGDRTTPAPRPDACAEQPGHRPTAFAAPASTARCC